ncbi:MAG: hypothetical protein AAB527_01000 [Patescibacteria group bacterium]
MNNLFGWVLMTTLLTVIFLPLREKNISKWIKTIGIAALLSLPVNINGNIFTIFGSAEGRNVYSLFSFYQKAEKDSFALFGAILQYAGKDAAVVLGLTGYQNAGRDAVVGIGLTGYQNAGNNAVVGAGLAGYQKGVSSAATYVGLGIYQSVGDARRTLGAFSSLSNK